MHSWNTCLESPKNGHHQRSQAIMPLVHRGSLGNATQDRAFTATLLPLLVLLYAPGLAFPPLSILQNFPFTEMQRFAEPLCPGHLLLFRALPKQS